MTYFDDSGRRIPTEGIRVFSDEPKNYYRINQQILNYELILNRLKQQNTDLQSIDIQEFESKIQMILVQINSNAHYKNLLNGVWIPFIYKRKKIGADLGSELNNELLPQVKRSFLEKNPYSEFKAVLQSNSELSNNVSLDPYSRYKKFIETSEQRAVIGIYFPQAFQGFDVDSQRSQMRTLTNSGNLNLCLTGGMDMCAALVGCPDLLFNEDNYSPIAIMSAYVHSDPRLIMMLKSYGPHLEFWCMTQMLTSRITQVAEQWSGGLTIYD